MHYFENETVMSLENALALKPNEISILGHVRTYEGDGDDILGYFVEIRCLKEGVAVKKNRIIDFPSYEIQKEQFFTNMEAATDVFRQWIDQIKTEQEKDHA